MIGFFPVISSRSITPKEKTSDRSLTLPEAAYSGAKYLSNREQITLLCTLEISETYDSCRVCEPQKVNYPKVPITRVETAVASAAWYLANPKSAT
jgi:hypothetical protein